MTAVATQADREPLPPVSSHSIFPLFVIIPNYNLAPDTLACVDSVLAAGERLAVTVVVVDNGSDDESVVALARTFGNRITQLSLATNRGFAAAVNAGIHHALACSAAAVLILNNDTVVDSAMLAALNKAAETHSGAGILAPAIYHFGQPGRIWRLGDRQPWWLPIPYKISDRELTQPAIPVDYVTGCAMLMRSEVIQAIGLFDEQFFMYYEDADFCRRATERGVHILCIPSARMWHKVSASASRQGSTRSYWQARGHAMFYRKHARGAGKLAVYAYVGLKSLATIVKLGAAGNWSASLAALRGTRDGYGMEIREAPRA
jgi:GT2 family glycosyltransferase